MSLQRKAYLVGGGIGSLAAAAFLIRDGDIAGSHIQTLEAGAVMGGSLDGAGDADRAYSTRSGRPPALSTCTLKTSEVPYSMQCCRCSIPRHVSRFVDWSALTTTPRSFQDQTGWAFWRAAYCARESGCRASSCSTINGPRFSEFVEAMSRWVNAEKVKVCEDVILGLEKAPEAFIGLLKGTNFGKLVVQVGRE